jgi:cytochrome c oxidase subunit IV
MAIDESNQKEKNKKHPPYLIVFFVLAILTAIEIAVTQLPLPRAPILIALSIIKATLVALFYMHLRTDRLIFSVIFVAGILLGLGMLISFIFLVNTHSGFGQTY